VSIKTSNVWCDGMPLHYTVERTIQLHVILLIDCWQIALMRRRHNNRESTHTHTHNIWLRTVYSFFLGPRHCLHIRPTFSTDFFFKKAPSHGRNSNYAIPCRKRCVGLRLLPDEIFCHFLCLTCRGQKICAAPPQKKNKK